MSGWRRLAAGCGGERIDKEGRHYCLYNGSGITETGFSCPSSFSHRTDMGGKTVCSKEGGEIPDDHREDIRDDSSADGWNPSENGERPGTGGSEGGTPPSGRRGAPANPRARCPDPPGGSADAGGGADASGGPADGGSIFDASGPAPPAPTLELKPEDGRTATQGDSSPRLVLQWNTEWEQTQADITRQTLQQVADNLTLRTWPDLETVPSTTGVGNILEEGGYKPGVGRKVTIDVEPENTFENTWYTLQLSGAPFEFVWDSRRRPLRLSNGERGIRFHPTSNPKLWRVRICYGPGGTTKLRATFSENLRPTGSRLAQSVAFSQNGRTFTREKAGVQSSIVTVGPEQFNPSQPVTIEVGSALDAEAGGTLEPTTYSFRPPPRCGQTCTLWRALLQ